jgi:L-threonylcarbamoyladenylate synthase
MRAAEGGVVVRTERLDPKRPSSVLVKETAELLKAGGVAAFPTDTIYGLGCSAGSTEGLSGLRRLKGAGRDSSFILLIGDVGWLRTLARRVTPLAEDLIRRYWPGPLSIVLDAAEAAPRGATCGRGTVAVRLPADLWCASLCRELGEPIASTSANPAGEKPAADAKEISRIFGDRLDLIVDGGPAPHGGPSTLVDARGRKPVVLRRGVLLLGKSPAVVENEREGADGDE